MLARHCLVASLSVGAMLAAVALSSAQQERSREAALAGIRSEIARLEERLAAAREREEGLTGRLESVEVELALQERRVAEAVAARELAAARVEEGQRAVVALSRTLEEARDLLGRRLSGLYRLGRQGPLRLFLSIEPDADLLPAVRLLRYLVRRDAEAIDRYVAAREELAREQQRLLERQAEAERWSAEEQRRRDRLLTVRRRQARLLTEAAEKRRSLAERTTRLEEKARRLGELIRSLDELAAVPGDGRPIQDFQGVLDWPVPGEVVAGFGPRLDPRYGTRVPHNGVEIAVAPGTSVGVVYPGKVLFAAPLEGYGPTAVILHPGRVFTLYAGLDRLRVGAEDVLSLSDTVGVAGDRLYFEIRVDNRPRDPLEWLR